VKPDNVLVSEGSTEILRAATQVFTAKTKPLVGTIPTYEECAGYAELMGNPVKGVKLNAEFKIDLDAYLAASKGAGLVFYCNPNNPTATYVGAKATRDYLTKITSASPDTTILVDEAYFDYVTDPDHETHVPIAVEQKNVIVARTFSKAYGMAGLRQGYAIAHADTIRKMRPWVGRGRHRVAQRVRHGGRRRGHPAGCELHRQRAEPQQGGPRLLDEVVRRPRHEADRLPGQLHVRQHRHAGEGVPRGLPRQGRDGRARLPAVREDDGPHHPRHDGRNAEGR
jgi:hypothetical protein